MLNFFLTAALAVSSSAAVAKEPIAPTNVTKVANVNCNGKAYSFQGLAGYGTVS